MDDHFPTVASHGDPSRHGLYVSGYPFREPIVEGLAWKMSSEFDDESALEVRVFARFHRDGSHVLDRELYRIAGRYCQLWWHGTMLIDGMLGAGGHIERHRMEHPYRPRPPLP